MFDRLLAMYGTSIKRTLTIQYRMHEKIMRFPSDALYEKKLTAAEGVSKRLLTDLPGVNTEEEICSEPVVFIDSAFQCCTQRGS